MYETEDTPPASLSKNDGSPLYENGVLLQAVSEGVEAAGQEDDSGDSKSGGLPFSSKMGRRSAVEASKKLKELGAKARNRLEEEKSKRPEIQILDQLPTSDPQKRVSRNANTSFSAKVASHKPAAANDTAINRKRKLILDQTRIAQKNGRTSTHPSLWTPDISHIELPENYERSATVKLHGLPIHCTIEHVRKFFAGLHLQNISILLPNNTAIADLDASNSPPSNRSRGEHYRLRVLAHFQSVSAAILASERSGETILTQVDDGNGNGNGDADKEEFVVAVTVLSEQLASALSLVALPAVPRQPFETTLKDVTNKSQLHPLVPKVLWSVAIRRLLHDSIPMERNIQKEEIVLLDEEPLWGDFQKQPGTGAWRSHPGYQRFAKQYNRLVDIQDELLHQIPYPMVETSSLHSQHSENEAGFQLDPAVRLTTEAYKALTCELDIIERLLHRARVSYNIISGQIGSKRND